MREAKMDKGTSGRQYWIFSEGPTTREMRRLNGRLNAKRWRPSFTERIEINKRLRELESEQYLDISTVVLQGHGLGFSVPREIPLYFYTQNGEAFEFFSGLRIGQVCHHYNDPYIESPYANSLYLKRPTYADDDFGVARELDASSFASEVKPLLPKKKQIASIVLAQFKRILAHKKRLAVDDKAKQDALAKKNQDAEDFLNNFID